MKVDELIALGGAAPPTPSSPPSPETVDEITKLYYEIYERGLARFFEGNCFRFTESQSGSPYFASVLRQHPSALALFATFLQTISEVRTRNPRDHAYSSHLESRLVWVLSRLPRQTASHQLMGYAPSENDLTETMKRVDIFDALVSGETLGLNPFRPSSPGINPEKRRELDFWYYLAEYLVQPHPSASPEAAKNREYYLGLLRTLLDGRENRDVLYSTVVLREYSVFWDAATVEGTLPAQLAESDPRCKLAVAARFIRDAATSGGTTNVVRRLADVAYQSFVRPGLNVRRS